MGHNQTLCTAANIGRAFPAVSFMYLSVECPFNKFYGINCRPKLGAKLLALLRDCNCTCPFEDHLGQTHLGDSGVPEAEY